MSMTLQISDGHIVIQDTNGQLATVSGNRKCAQDMGEVLLQQYDPVQDYGSYLTSIIKNQIPGAGDLLVRLYTVDAVNRLQSKQQEDPYCTTAEMIADITGLDTVADASGTVGFYVVVSTEDGGSSEAGAVSPTALNQLTEGF
jgi:hypothetical protein